MDEEKLGTYKAEVNVLIKFINVLIAENRVFFKQHKASLDVVECYSIVGALP